MGNQQQGQGQGQGQNPGQKPPMTDKKEFKKNVKQQDTKAGDDKDLDNGAYANKAGSRGSSSDKQDEE